MSLLDRRLFCLISLPLATCAGRAPLSVVCTEDIKCPAFTEELELLLHAGVLLLSQRLRQEIRRYLRAAWAYTNEIVAFLHPGTTPSLRHGVRVSCRDPSSVNDKYSLHKGSWIGNMHVLKGQMNLLSTKTRKVALVKSSFAYFSFRITTDISPKACDGAVSGLIMSVTER